MKKNEKTIDNLEKTKYNSLTSIDNKSNCNILLDSSLITTYESEIGYPTEKIIYDVKVVSCGDYLQVYKFDGIKSKKNDDIKKYPLEEINLKKIDTENLYKTESGGDEPKSILLANAIRSNLNCQRIAKTNRDVWESFITLTFSENLTDLKKANSIFNDFVSNIRKLKPDFKYLAVPEFQKRGAVHYHLLSNLGKDDTNIILKQKEKKGNALYCDQLYDVRYWSKGFARVDFIKNDYKKIYSYICKYMTKDIDNKLFGHRRYFYSLNLKRPKVEYLNLSNERDYNYYMTLLSDKNIDFKSNYVDLATDVCVNFFELSTSDNVDLC